MDITCLVNVTESVMDEDSSDDVSPPYCPESSSAEFLADSKVGILDHTESGTILFLFD